MTNCVCKLYGTLSCMYCRAHTSASAVPSATATLSCMYCRSHTSASALPSATATIYCMNCRAHTPASAVPSVTASSRLPLYPGRSDPTVATSRYVAHVLHPLDPAPLDHVPLHPPLPPPPKIQKVSGPGSLVLLDEVGSGTDPLEGGRLGWGGGGGWKAGPTKPV